MYFGEVAKYWLLFILPRRNHFKFSSRCTKSNFTLKKGFLVKYLGSFDQHTRKASWWGPFKLTWRPLQRGDEVKGLVDKTKGRNVLWAPRYPPLPSSHKIHLETNRINLPCLLLPASIGSCTACTTWLTFATMLVEWKPKSSMVFGQAGGTLWL